MRQFHLPFHPFDYSFVNLSQAAMQMPKIVLSVAIILVVSCDELQDSLHPQIKLIRVKRRGGGGGGCSGGGYGTRVSMPSSSSSGGGKQMDPLQLALGAKALVLKALLIKQLMESSSTQPPVVTNVNNTSPATTAPAGRLTQSGRMRTASSRKKN